MSFPSQKQKKKGQLATSTKVVSGRSLSPLGVRYQTVLKEERRDLI